MNTNFQKSSSGTQSALAIEMSTSSIVLQSPKLRNESRLPHETSFDISRVERFALTTVQYHINTDFEMLIFGALTTIVTATTIVEKTFNLLRQWNYFCLPPVASSPAPVVVQLRGNHPVQEFHGPFIDALPPCSHHHHFKSHEPGLWTRKGCGM